MPTKRTARDFALLGLIWAELGSGRISQGFIVDPSRPRHRMNHHGWIEGGHITVNPAPDVVNTVIHEILHRLHPEWGETYLEGRVTYLIRRMSDEEIQAMYQEFQRRAKKRKTPKVITE